MVLYCCDEAVVDIDIEEARPATEIKAKNGAYVQNEDFRPSIRMYHTQLKALVQGHDFDINELGEIKRLR